MADRPLSSVMHSRNLAMVMTTILIWALAFPIIKVALEDFPPITMALVRFAIASLFFLALQFTIGGGMAAIRSLTKRLWVLIIIFGVVQSAITNIAQNIGMQWTEAGVASIIQSVGPVFAGLFAHGGGDFGGTLAFGRQDLDAASTFRAVGCFRLGGCRLDYRWFVRLCRRCRHAGHEVWQVIPKPIILDVLGSRS